MMEIVYTKDKAAVLVNQKTICKDRILSQKKTEILFNTVTVLVLAIFLIRKTVL